MKHVALADGIRRLIRQQKLGVGQAIPTEAVLGESFNCSRGTVRRALDTLVSEGLICRKHGSGHYVARPPESSRQLLLGLVVPNILNAEILRLAQLFTLEAGKKGYGIVLSMTNDQPAVEREFVREMHRLNAAGIIRFPTIPEAPDFESDIRSRLRAAGLPYVLVDDFWTDTSRDHHVAFDEAAALEMAVEHLTGLGHSRIGWADGSDGPRRRALQHLRDLLAKQGLTLPDAHVLLHPPYQVPPVEKMWQAGELGPTAIITPYDGIAVRLIEALQHINRKVPEDVSIVNLNGQPFYATPGLDLTTAVAPYDRMVEKTVEILLNGDQEMGACHCIFRPAFHVGRTSGRAAPGAV